MQQINHVYDQQRPFVMLPIDILDLLTEPRDLAVYCVLKKFANWQTGLAHPSRQTLAKALGYSTNKPIDTALKSLEEKGLLAVFPRFKSTSGQVAFVRDEVHTMYTSNGYVVFDHPVDEGEKLAAVKAICGGVVGRPVSTSVPEGGVPQDTRVGHSSAPGWCTTVDTNYINITKLKELNVSGASPDGEHPTQAPTPVAQSRTATSKGEYLPDGWVPPANIVEDIRRRYPNLDLVKEHESFTDYWQAASGQKARKRNWGATWRTWMKRAGENYFNSQPAARGSEHDWAALEHRALAALNEDVPEVLGGGESWNQLTQ